MHASLAMPDPWIGRTLKYYQGSGSSSIYYLCDWNVINNNCVPDVGLKWQQYSFVWLVVDAERVQSSSGRIIRLWIVCISCWNRDSQ